MDQVEVMKQLQHPNIVQLLEVIDNSQSNTLYLVQEYMANGSVMTEAEYNTPLDDDVCRVYFR
jgi:serine/threonine protein kinase